MKRKARWGWLALMALVASCKCGSETEPTGTGGSGEPPPLVEVTTPEGGERVTLAIIEAFTRREGTPTRTSFVTSEELVVRARVTGGEAGLVDRIQWTVTSVGTRTGPAEPATATGAELTFRGKSAQSVAGSRDPNPPLEYEVLGALDLGDGRRLEVKLPPSSFLRQDETDTLRQEYVDYDTDFQPTLANVRVPGNTTLNRGNYTLIAEETPGDLDRLLQDVDAELNKLLKDDVQVVPVGTATTSPATVVVSPGPSVLMLGPLGDTNPSGDDVCSGLRVGGLCAGSILAGPNRRADTTANNRFATVSIEPFITSAFRNPQRNRFIGSGSINSRHTRGRALDLDPRSMVVPGRDARQMMCLVELAGIRVVGEEDSFTENGPVTFLDCNDPAADHVHIQR